MQYNTNKLALFDIESGGLSAEEHSILSLGMVIWNRNTGETEDELELFIREDPIVAVEAALKVNKIDLEWLKEHGKPPKESMAILKNFLVKNFGQPGPQTLVTLCSFNAKFDELFFRRFCYLAGLYSTAFDERFAYPKLCALEFTRFYNAVFGLQLENCKFDSVLKYFGITRTGEAHSALDDTRNLAQLLNKFRDSFKLEIT